MLSFSSLALLALAYLSSLALASPLDVRDPLDVAAPPVTYPTQGVVWTPGQTQTVTWYVIPPSRTVLYSRMLTEVAYSGTHLVRHIRSRP